MRILILLTLAFASSGIWADDAAPATAESALSAVATLRDETNWLWTCIAGFLVFLCKQVSLWSKPDLPERKIQ